MDVTRKYPTVNLDKGSTIFQSRKFQKVSSDLNGIYIYITGKEENIRRVVNDLPSIFLCQAVPVCLFIYFFRSRSLYEFRYEKS